MPKKEIRQLIKELEKQGFRVTQAGSGHFIAWPPDVEVRPVTIPSTPSDYRSMRNTLADLRRAGFEPKGR